MANPEYTYATGGNYEVKLVVTSSRGCTREITKTVSITTSVKDIAELASARLYPNPASSSALLELSMQQPVQAQVRIVAMNGAVLSQRTERLNQGVQTLELSLDHIPTGLYMVQVVTNEGTRSIKLQVQQH
jgi:PKD repeat protein